VEILTDKQGGEKVLDGSDDALESTHTYEKIHFFRSFPSSFAYHQVIIQ
jgi:hypothetical protein